MESSSSMSRKSIDLPVPDTGLAEWASKIKALQREVDADEEVEQKRLEEEIAAAREARLRRSSRAGAPSRVDSVDLASSRERSNISTFTNMNNPPTSVDDRSNMSDTALRKLMERNEVYNPDKTSIRISEKPDSVSLAAFIGGRATGPRLNKHAPQQDAHDPTQFIQPDLSAPHPVFGKGGVAMPGMAKKASSTPGISGSENSERYRPSLNTAKSTSALGNLYLQKISTPIKAEDADTQQEPSTDNYNVTAPLRIQKTGDKFVSSNPVDTPPIQESAPTVTKASDTFRSSVTTFTSIPKGTSAVTISHLPKQEEISIPKSNASRYTDTFRSSSNTFASTPATYSSAYSYTSGKEETASVDLDKSTKPSGTTSTASKPSPYVGSAKIVKSISSEPKTTSPPSTTPLRRLMETNNVYNPDKDLGRKSIAERAQNVSLAGFIGGSGKGPRLNRPAPQPDAHDPTQFIQPDTSTPHPVFGRGGVAMPGLVTRKTSDSPEPSGGTENLERYRPSPSATKKLAVWPPVSATPDTRQVFPQKTGGRERTTSTPNPQVPIVSALYSSSAWSASNKVVDRKSPTKELVSATSVRERTISGPSYPYTAPVSTPSRQSTNTPSLARPLQPRPKSTSYSPQISGSATSPSLAFLKPPPQKELTPSISRLQGRGFVQNMVQASQFSPSPSGSPSTPIEKPPPRPLSASGKRNSVLNRWQPHMQSSSPTKTSFSLSPSTGKISSIQGQFQNNISLPSDSALSSVKASSIPIPPSRLPSAASKSQVEDSPDPYPRSRTPGLGSATTMILIKPSKSSSDIAQIHQVDELGIRHVPGQADGLPSSKKPLIHPTKYRPRKPRKSSETFSSQKPLLETSHSTEGDSKAHSSSVNTDFQNEQAIAIPLLPEPNESPNRHLIEDPQDLEDFSAPNHILRGVSLTAECDENPAEQQRYLTTHTERTPSPEPSMPKVEKISYNPPPSPSFRRQPPSLSTPSSPVKSKHVRIPSTGNRPTVMEVAQALLVQDQSNDDFQTTSKLSGLPSPENLPKSPGVSSHMQSEKIKSSYEKYPSPILPTLKEEATPIPSPVGTLARVQPQPDHPILTEVTNMVAESEPIAENLSVQATKLSAQVLSDDVQKISLQDVDVNGLLLSSRSYTLPPETRTISVEVLAITGTTATPVTKSPNIFYESEILTIIHRTKSQSTGFAETSVWCWLGRKSILGDREGRKVDDLAKRYGTTAKMVYQLAEPAELVHILGGELAIRQGTRSHWSPDNTTMHLVRFLHGVIFIDEHDLNIKNLCSAYSYCFTVLGSVYIWYGCGSTTQEREASFKYTQTFSLDAVTPIVLSEGEDDQDEMFWMILGDDEYAKADYWRWRKNSTDIDPALWRVDIEGDKYSIHPIQFVSLEENLPRSVYVISLIWEYFVLVGQNARSNKQAIRLAIDLVMKMASDVASERPYFPTVHVLILPSRIPLDLRLGTRDMDEAWLNNGEIPDHMNLLHSTEALQHLSTCSWEKSLPDRDMVPLGVGNASA